MSKIHDITLIDGDGIGPEITEAVVKIIEATGVKINWDKQLAGIRAFEKYNTVLPDETIKSIFLKSSMIYNSFAEINLCSSVNRTQ